MTCPIGESIPWRGCYSGQYDLWGTESYRHPAKMSPALAFRILEHLEKLGLLRPGQTVLDPMCGIGTTLLVAAVNGHPAVGIELEERFVSLAQANADRIALKGFGSPIRVIQGDARHLSTLLVERGLVAMSSPPYAEAQSGGGISASMRGEGHYHVSTKLPSSVYQPAEHGTSEGQIGNLPDRPCAITSPPYEDQLEAAEGREWLAEHSIELGRRGKSAATTLSKVYGTTDGQLGQKRGETYLSAMRQVYAEIAKVASVLVVVIKNPTRNGKLRDLSGDTAALLEATGWRIVDWHHATLFEEQEQSHLFGGNVKQPKGRLSFFKRLSYRKGAPVADHEDVIFAEVTA